MYKKIGQHLCYQETLLTNFSLLRKDMEIEL